MCVAMASNHNINKCNSRKRKSDVDLIFEVNEDDCSPPSSPEQGNISNDDPKTPKEACSPTSIVQTVMNISDSNKVLILSEEDKMPLNSAVNEEQSKVEIGRENEKKEMLLPTDKFLFSIKFRDRNFADAHKERIINAIKSALNCNVREEVDEVGLKVKFWEGKSASDMEITDNSDEGLCLNDGADIDNLFVVDTTPSSNKSLNGQPKFYSRTKYTIDEKSIRSELCEKPKSNCNPSSCFNCDGPHALKDCKEQRNYKKITMARNKHKEMKSAKNTRYHLEEEQKYGNLVPGKLSDKLREALGVGQDEIPAHVYHMRRLGYPLGWLEVAKRTASDLALYDFQGREDQRHIEPSNHIDPDKVAEYPGFNVPGPEGSRDLHARYSCPPFSEQHSKSAMLAQLAKSKRKVSQDKSPRPETDAAALRSDSPSLGELERQKQQLLDMLNNGVSVAADQREHISLEQLTSDTPPSVVRTSAYGTPLLKGCSPYDNLPRPENFSVGVSQVINFENLPESTGKYQQMTCVLGKVRKTIRYTTEDTS